MSIIPSSTSTSTSQMSPNYYHQSSPSPSQSPSQTSQWICRAHPSAECITYCADCSAAICQHCITIHSRHRFVSLDDPSLNSAKHRRLQLPLYGSEEHAKLLLAKSFFELKEYLRCADVLTMSKCCTSSVSRFLRIYSLYLAYEKRSQEESIVASAQDPAQAAAASTGAFGADPSTTSDLKPASQGDANSPTSHFKTVSKEMQQLAQQLEQWLGEYVDIEQQDPFLLYIYAAILKQKNDVAGAKSALVRSVTHYPCNWSAWLDLASLCNDIHSVSQLILPDHFMKEFFFAHVTQELHQNKESLQMYAALSKTFPRSNYILAQTAIGNYNIRAYDIGEELFGQLLEREPHRLESIDIYSNILYVHNNKSKLSVLAHRAMATEKYCPETCCIIGNYYSLRLEHEKAILYFQRALKLNDKYLAAWTLIGHEYLEIKNVGAAINAYRRAVDINPKEYRAWYGLGQTYQLLKQPLYSLFYFQKATSLRPYDPRMWCSVAGCYEILERIPDAIRCYERAEDNFDRERVALSKLAKLYQDMQRYEEAAHYYRKNLHHRDAEKIDGQETIDALLFLANYHKNIGELDQAEKYCLRLLDYAGPEKEEAKALLRDVHSCNKQ
ncbi:hypothetical protein SAMD00019534_004740 [Acytostelium subglobosum LB1]|uniref:hypothetical protein n=1 Tax=Acytostelium subglobosum LB1 TaxID=1410327 RepID=UPI0006451F72|nr:hypothetical protein SAMD00019534_004740 [Acytostelium subglobosum LB1]GAM17299.1 hypothetical protein SAMD00019534_004740 [Acytostelium subglobosum LB1]|eukprot:XP_012759361.1 hypothetical protein SAMD00019534_004740 [Acytostelium subglobosum LB1]